MTPRSIVWQSAKNLPIKKNGYVFIYKLCDPVTGKPFYVGQTVRPRNRCKSHYNKRKIAFTMHIIEVVPEAIASEKEQWHIRHTALETTLENRSVFAPETWWKRLAGGLFARTEERLSQ